MAVDDTTDHSLPSWGYPVFAAVCLTGEAGVGQHGSTFQSGHKHKQSRFDGLVTNTSKAGVCETRSSRRVSVFGYCLMYPPM